MKKAIVMLVVMAVAVAGLAGCGGGQTDSEMLRIGIVQFAPHPSLDNCREGFIEGMRLAGFGDERVTFDYQNANADMNLANTIAQKMVADGADLIVGIATPAAQAAFNAAIDTDIPIVFIAVSYPNAAGLTGHANVTGVSDILQVDKQIALIEALLPEARTIGVLYNTGEVNSVRQVEMLGESAEKSGFELVAATVTNVSDVMLALESLLPRIDVLVNVLDNTVVSAMPSVVDRCTERGTPIIGSEDEQVRNGALASDGFDYIDVGKQSAVLAIRILNDERNIEFELVNETQIVINEAVAEALGIEIPEEIAATAQLVR